MGRGCKTSVRHKLRAKIRSPQKNYVAPADFFASLILFLSKHPHQSIGFRENHLSMRYTTGLFLFAILILFFGFVYDKITFESLQYISVPGLLMAVVKSLVVVLVLLLSLAISTAALVIDLILLLFTQLDFPLLSYIWNIAWEEVTMSWFWTATSGSSLFFGALILLLLGGGLSRRPALV